MIEIERLAKMLKNAGIPFERANDPAGILPKEWRMRRLKYPSKENEVCSVIQGKGSYGNAANLLEIRGLLTAKEGNNNSVLGWLTAENVFDRIKNHWGGTPDNRR